MNIILSQMKFEKQTCNPKTTLMSSKASAIEGHVAPLASCKGGWEIEGLAHETRLSCCLILFIMMRLGVLLPRRNQISIIKEVGG